MSSKEDLSETLAADWRKSHPSTEEALRRAVQVALTTALPALQGEKAQEVREALEALQNAADVSADVYTPG
jgi:hypothetical protein